ncbi:MAG TPA: hypothetical protein VLY86_00855, partial [Methanothrix sp.]|nr:hypothetical protein [Methanothrix sp.]
MRASQLARKDGEFNPADWWGGKIPAGVCIKGEATAPATAPAASASRDGPFWKRSNACEGDA